MKYINWGLAVPLLLTALAAGATDAASILATNQSNWLFAFSVGLATFLATMNTHVKDTNATSRIAAVEGTTFQQAIKLPEVTPPQ